MEIIDISQSDDLVNVIRKCNLNFRQVARSSRQELDRQSRIDTNNLVVYVDDSIDDALSTLSTEVQNMIASKSSKSETVSDISRSGEVVTVTRADGTTFTFTLPDQGTPWSGISDLDEITSMQDGYWLVVATPTGTYKLAYATLRDLLSDYDNLTNKPQIEGVTLQGNKTYEELNMCRLTNTEIENLLS